MGGGARSAPFCMLMSLKKTGARSARARTRGQNPLVHSKGLRDTVFYIIKAPGIHDEDSINHHHQKFIIEDNHLTIILLLYIIYYIRI
jgi:hypothetical protein